MSLSFNLSNTALCWKQNAVLSGNESFHTHACLAKKAKLSMILSNSKNKFCGQQYYCDGFSFEQRINQKYNTIKLIQNQFFVGTFTDLLKFQRYFDEQIRKKTKSRVILLLGTESRIRCNSKEIFFFYFFCNCAYIRHLQSL